VLTAAEFNQLATLTGEPVDFIQAKPPNITRKVQGIVASTSKAAETIVNAFGVSGTSVQVAAAIFVPPPEKFDIFILQNGKRIVIDTVIAHAARGSGVVTSYTCYAKGH
jgi:hypothetical protein